MLEIEIKAYCEDHNNIIKRIISLGAGLKSKTSERDIYFKHPARDFAKTDEALRIRIQDGKTFLTYKGPKIGNKTKTRIEQETEFRDLDSMMNILHSLGFVIVEEVNKNRIIYSLNDIDICLDNVQGLGSFVEIEKIGQDQQQIEGELFRIAEELGLSKFERKSYLELKLEKTAGSLSKKL